MFKGTHRVTCTALFLFVSQVFHLVQAYAPISDDTLRLLRRPTPSEFDIHTGSILSPILIPRVPGTENSTKVLQHFVSYFRDNLPNWTIEIQNSTFTTPTSNGAEIPFRNFIASRDPPWAAPGDTGRLSLVAHYDSKQDPVGFIGAFDSAAPCAMIMHALREVDSALSAKWDAMKAQGIDNSGLEEHKGVQVIFLDGEEAFLSWTATDSVYGARSLAQEWDESLHPARSTFRTKLESISLFVLLDLLGAKEPLVPSYFRTTHWAYQGLGKLEQRLRSLNLLKSTFDPAGGHKSWFLDIDKSAHDPNAYFPSRYMQDDHIPFMERGVEIMHLIPIRFPPGWHTIEDDAEHLDMPSVEDWAILTAAFVAEWMELEGYVQKAPIVKKNDESIKASFWDKEHIVGKTEL